MTTFSTRPGTPFPTTTESDSYFNMPSTISSSRHQHQYAQPIHFQLPTRTVLTPPSLLKRASSSGSSSSSSTYRLSRTPSAGTPTTPVLSRSRRESQCSSCGSGSSPVMPSTPILEDVFGEDEPELNLEAESNSSSETFKLPEPLYTPTTPTKAQFSIPTNEANKTFSVKKFKPTLETITQQQPQTPTPTVPMTLMLPPPTFTRSRPTLKRRDTPRPKSEPLAMTPFWDQPILSPIEENMPKRKLTSLVDGLSWIVVE